MVKGHLPIVICVHPFAKGKTMENSSKITKGSIGGRGGSATPGGYNQGLQFAPAGKVGGTQGLTHVVQKDLRGGSSNAVSGYNQGVQFAATKGTSPQGVTPTHKDLRGGNSNPNTGYNQGNQK